MADRQHRGAEKEPVSSGSVAEVRRDGGRKGRSSVGEGKGEYLGLCASCELRETCEKPKLPGGVWSCSEYSEL